MWRQWLHSIKEGSQYRCFDILGTLDCPEIQMAVFQYKKGALEVLSQGTFSQWKDLEALPHKNLPCLMNFADQQVLTRPLTQNSPEPQEILLQAFPNIKVNDFYYEMAGVGTIWATLCKREVVDSLLGQLESWGFPVLGFQLGHSPLFALGQTLEGHVLTRKGQQLCFQQGQLRSVTDQDTPSPQTIDLKGLSLATQNIVPFGLLLGHLQGQVNPNNFEQRNGDFRDNLHLQRYFSFGIKAGLGLILGVLLMNFLAFQHYFSEVGRLQAQLSTDKAAGEKLRSLSDQVTQKEKRVQSLMSNAGSQTSKYLDILGAMVPGTVLLDRLEYQPLLKKPKQGDPLLLETDIYLIGGNSNDPEAFSDWLAELEGLDWIANVSTLEYDYQKRNNTQFLIKIERHEP